MLVIWEMFQYSEERENKWLSALQSAGEENTSLMLVYSGPALIIFSFSQLEYTVMESVSVLLAYGLYCWRVLCVTCAPAAGLWKGILLDVLCIQQAQFICFMCVLCQLSGLLNAPMGLFPFLDSSVDV